MNNFAVALLLGLIAACYSSTTNLDFIQQLSDNRTYWIFNTSYMWDQYTLCHHYKKYKRPSDSPLILKHVYEVYDNLTVSPPPTLKEYSLWRVEGMANTSDKFLFTRMRDRLNITYKLEYWNETQKCFIFTFNVSDTEQCELDVWDKLPEIEANVSSCLVELAKMPSCKASRYYFYDNCDHPSKRRRERSN
uniref:Lipocalin n=1 Tax=Rhipicephalus appendiculatus TaxID=34631 RepID=A0A131YQG5_RHIAP